MDRTLRCEVEDTDPTLRARRSSEDDKRETHLIDQLACCWGSAHTSAGKAVWFELSERVLSCG